MVIRITRVRVLSSGTEHYATLRGEEVHILSQPPFDELIESGERVSMSEVRLLAPTVPVNYWGVEFNYADHLEQAAATGGQDIPTLPRPWHKGVGSLIEPVSL